MYSSLASVVPKTTSIGQITGEGIIETTKEPLLCKQALLSWLGANVQDRQKGHHHNYHNREISSTLYLQVDLS